MAMVLYGALIGAVGYVGLFVAGKLLAWLIVAATRLVRWSRRWRPQPQPQRTTQARRTGDSPYVRRARDLGIRFRSHGPDYAAYDRPTYLRRQQAA